MKIGLTSYSLNADIMSGRKTILDAMRFAAKSGAKHMEIVPFGFTLYDDGRDEFNQPLIDSIRQTAEALESYDMPELRYFREHFLGSFQLTLDEME